MPLKALAPCLEPGCNKLVAKGRCPAHIKAHNSQTYSDRNKDEVSKMYRTSRWARFRQWFLRKYCLCERIIDGKRCEQFATLVHHRKSPRECPDLFCDEENCRALCSAHHHAHDGDVGDEVYAQRES